jgi:uncharacterized protein involved in exopolysaccharide biosynthesis
MESLVERETAPAIDPIGLLMRHRWKSLIVASIIGVLTLLVTATSQPKYESTAQLYIQLGRESVSLDPTATTGQIVSLGDTRESEMNSFFEILKSDEVLKKVVEEVTPRTILGNGTLRETLSKIEALNAINLNPFRIYSLNERAEYKLDKFLKVRTTKNSNVIDISYQSYSKDVAHEVLTSLIKQAKAKHLEVHRVEGSNQFFSDQAELHGDKLAELDERIRTFKTENGLASLQDQRTIQLAQIGTLETETSKLLSQKLALEDEIKQREEELQIMPATLESEVVTNLPKTASDDMLSELYKLQLEEKKLLASHQEDHPKVVQVRDQIAHAKKAVAQEPPKPQVTRKVSEWRERSAHDLRDRNAQLVSLTTQYATVKGDLATARARIKRMNDQELQLRKWERERDIAEVAYKKYQENFEQTRIDRELQERNISNIKVQQEPTLNETPASPNIMLNFAVGGILAILSGAGTAVWGENRLAKRQREAARQLSLAKSATNGVSANGSTNGSANGISTEIPVTGPAVAVRLPADKPAAFGDIIRANMGPGEGRLVS